MSERTDAATRMAEAADLWLGALDDDQRELAQWDFPADDERRLWFYTPTDHGGLTVGAMRPTQQQAAMRLLRSGLSRAAYVTATTIMGLENVLDEVERFRQGFGRERGRDPGMYYVRVFGTPGPGATWGWRFGGHHVSVNHTVVDGELGRVDPVLPRRRPGRVAAPRSAPAAPAGGRRGPRSRARPLARRRTARPRPARTRRAGRPGLGEPPTRLARRPAVAAADDLPRPAGSRDP